MFKNALDGKPENFVSVELHTAELVAAKARAASHVANAVIGLCRFGNYYRKLPCKISGP